MLSSVVVVAYSWDRPRRPFVPRRYTVGLDRLLLPARSSLIIHTHPHLRYSCSPLPSLSWHLLLHKWIVSRVMPPGNISLIPGICLRRSWAWLTPSALDLT